MRLIIHIGAPKTGSTAVQRFLHGNRSVLEESGILYPEVNLRGFGHHDLAFLIGGGYPDWATAQSRSLDDLVADLRQAIAVAQTDTLLISSENFFIYPNVPLLRSVLEAARFEGEIKVLVYLRSQDEALASWYNQAVKAQGYSGTFADALTEFRDLWDYEQRLQPWADGFGIKSLLVRDYDAIIAGGTDIRRDLMDVLGLDAADFYLSPDKENTRINRDILEFQRLLNRLPLSAQEKRAFHRDLIELTAATAETDLFDDSPLLTESLRREIRDCYAEGNGRIAQTYFGRESLFAQNTHDSTRKPEPAAIPLTGEKLVTILGWLLVRYGKTTY